MNQFPLIVQKLFPEIFTLCQILFSCEENCYIPYFLFGRKVALFHPRLLKCISIIGKVTLRLVASNHFPSFTYQTEIRKKACNDKGCTLISPCSYRWIFDLVIWPVGTCSVTSEVTVKWAELTVVDKVQYSLCRQERTWNANPHWVSKAVVQICQSNLFVILTLHCLCVWYW